MLNDTLRGNERSGDAQTNEYEAASEDEQERAGDERGLARIERVRRSARTDIEQFESREAALRERFQAAVEQ